MCVLTVRAVSAAVFAAADVCGVVGVGVVVVDVDAGDVVGMLLFMSLSVSVSLPF